ncbi:glycosyltransferase family 4 protein [Oxynema aestuarii]|uniref:Glycosyltransferase family 4 protein n=1 Tax=Oxynema aestuarii AP17 TaxID=2064643 RepID=A0A6H1U4K3_9CYAN|nr:glycosyltransferase family 4 protein [Oxynema aestuarii]QIZ72963.1 glycosyltransferase family 4 protein [Oxynema aestuarii AP17]
MYIIALETDPSSSLGGKHLSLFEVCQELAKRGHHIILIYLRTGDLLEEYQKFCVNLIHIEEWRIDRQHPITSSIKFLKTITAVSCLLKIPSYRNSLIYFDNYLWSPFAIALSYLKRIPSVFHIRLALGEKIIFHKQDTYAISKINRFIAISNHTLKTWSHTLNLSPSKIQVIYNGTNTEKFKPITNYQSLRKQWKIPPGTRVISYIGRLDPEKGIETLLKACALAIVKFKIPLKIFLAGIPVAHRTEKDKQQYQLNLQKLIKDLKLQNNVKILGHVKTTSILYQLSDLTILPSIYPEPFGRSIIESMACGTPVIASNIGGIPEILGSDFEDQMFQPGDEEELSLKINAFINWRDRQKYLGEKSRKCIIEKFTLDNTIDRIEQLLLKI